MHPDQNRRSLRPRGRALKQPKLEDMSMESEHTHSKLGRLHMNTHIREIHIKNTPIRGDFRGNMAFFVLWRAKTQRDLVFAYNCSVGWPSGPAYVLVDDVIEWIN